MGGDVNVCYNLSKQLAKRGHDVIIITTDFEFDKGYAKILEEMGASVIPFHTMVNIKLFLISPNMNKWLKKEIKDFDVIHVHNFRSYQNVIVYRYAKKYGIPYVLQAHGSLPRIIEKQMLKKIYDWVWGTKMLNAASTLIALTETEAEQYGEMGVYEDKIKIVPNGIDLSEYDNLPEKGEFRKKYLIRDNEKMILYLGRLHKSKGIDLLVKAFASLSKELNNIKLVLVGPDGGYQSALEEQVRALELGDKVIFTGFVKNDEKMMAFVDANVFVTPRFSGFPVTFLEACACGTPILTTNAGDKIDWIQDKIGFTVEYDEVPLQDAMFKVLCDEGLKRRFWEEGRKLVREEFSWDKLIKGVEDIYGLRAF